MANDYYRILQVPRNASGDELKNAAEAKLKQISKAYDVLSDPRKRAAYDQYGEEGLRRGAPPPDSPGSSRQNGRPPEYLFSDFFGSRTSEPRVRVSQSPGVFTEFFGSPASEPRVTVSRSPEDVFSTVFGGRGEAGGSRSPENRNVFGEDIFESFRNVTMDSGNAPRKAAAIETTLPCTLEELYQGATKKMKISRNVIGASGRKTTVEEILNVEIRPGWKKGTKITFPEKGNDEQKGVIPADIIFVVDEKPHSLYERDGNDLIVSRNISLADALTGHTARLKTLDGRTITVFVDSVVSLNHQEVVRGEGMPISKEPSKRGNLIVKFTINFPTLTSEQKTGIQQLLNLHKSW